MFLRFLTWTLQRPDKSSHYYTAEAIRPTTPALLCLDAPEIPQDENDFPGLAKSVILGDIFQRATLPDIPGLSSIIHPIHLRNDRMPPAALVPEPHPPHLKTGKGIKSSRCGSTCDGGTLHH